MINRIAAFLMVWSLSMLIGTGFQAIFAGLMFDGLDMSSFTVWNWLFQAIFWVGLTSFSWFITDPDYDTY